jgi:2-polyprenyl-3-methyl-5-hydroxy-6-metoxy-1,4-benzoquinol methylase
MAGLDPAIHVPRTASTLRQEGVDHRVKPGDEIEEVVVQQFGWQLTMKSAEVAQMWEANAETWTRHARNGYDVYRDALNTPEFLAMLPPISGLCGLDVGCGEGSNTRALARLGARVHAIDIAPTFVRHAQAAEASDPLGIVFQVAMRWLCPSRTTHSTS